MQIDSRIQAAALGLQKQLRAQHASPGGSYSKIISIGPAAHGVKVAIVMSLGKPSDVQAVVETVPPNIYHFDIGTGKVKLKGNSVASLKPVGDYTDPVTGEYVFSDLSAPPDYSTPDDSNSAGSSAGTTSSAGSGILDTLTSLFNTGVSGYKTISGVNAGTQAANAKPAASNTNTLLYAGAAILALVLLAKKR